MRLQDPIDIAEALALGLHGPQYVNEHVKAVVKVVCQLTDDPEILVAAYLHDTAEDCGLSIEDIHHIFGATVAQYVDLVTTRLSHGRNRRERQETLYKMTSTNFGASIVKVADRYANTVGRFVAGDASKLDMYRKEHEMFRGFFYEKTKDVAEELWREMDMLLSSDR